MSKKVYRVNSQWQSQAISTIKCQDEGKELQLLLENNLDLLPGDQINEEDPRRWLLIRREMPVHDPSSGDTRWSVDLLMVDQDAIPTFVECKRALDTRSRREVVGQMFDYAANGHYYWTREYLREQASATAQAKQRTLEDDLADLGAENPEDVDQFFDRVVENLREGQLRLVFFLEESPYELRSIVDFLNRQTERTEIMIVEARQYESDDLRIVVPTVFGYTEQARRIKKQVSTNLSARQKWTENMFFERIADHVDPEEAQLLDRWHRSLLSAGFEYRMGSGTHRGTISYLRPQRFKRSLISVYTDGDLVLNLPWLDDTIDEEQRRDQWIEDLRGIKALDVPDKPAHQRFRFQTWWPVRDQIIESLLRAAGVANTQNAELHSIHGK